MLPFARTSHLPESGFTGRLATTEVEVLPLGSERARWTADGLVSLVDKLILDPRPHKKGTALQTSSLLSQRTSGSPYQQIKKKRVLR